MSEARAVPSLSVWVTPPGVVGGGWADWPAARATLCAPAGWQPQPADLPPGTRLSAAERRRAGALVRLSVAVADEACMAAGMDPAQLATVFTSSSGDGANCHALCEALAQPERLVSPTRFTNSVHNAPAGYWHIGTHSRAPSTSLCAHDGSFAAGLLEAASQCVAGQRPVLLVAADMPYPEPLHAVRPLPLGFGVALLLHPQPVPGARRLSLAAAGQGAPTPAATPELEALRRAVPAARALPLLQALAGADAAALQLDGFAGCGLSLAVDAAEARA